MCTGDRHSERTWGPLGFLPRNKLLYDEAEQELFDTYSFMLLHMLMRSSSQGAGTHLSLEKSSINSDPVIGPTENAAKAQNPIEKGRSPLFLLKPTKKTHLSRIFFGYGSHILKIHLKNIIVPGVH